MKESSLSSAVYLCPFCYGQGAYKSRVGRPFTKKGTFTEYWFIECQRCGIKTPEKLSKGAVTRYWSKSRKDIKIVRASSEIKF